MRSRYVRNFNMLLNMSDHVLIYCSWGQGTQKKIQHSTHSGNSSTSHAHFVAIPLRGPGGGVFIKISSKSTYQFDRFNLITRRFNHQIDIIYRNACNLDKFVPLLPETLFHFPKRFSWNVQMFYRSKQLIEYLNQQFKSLQAHSNR